MNFIKKIVKFHQKPYTGSRVVPYRDRQTCTDMTKLTVTFRNFANTPKKGMTDCVLSRELPTFYSTEATRLP